MMAWLKGGGLFSGFRSLAHHAVSLVQTRLELFSIELQIERQRLLTALILALASAVLCLLMAFVFIVGILELAWDTGWRRPVIWLLFILLLSLFVGFFYTLVRMIKRSSRPFSATLRELKKDSEALKALRK